MSVPAAPDRRTCVCGRPKDKRSVMCRDCRRAANEVGAAVVMQLRDTPTPAPPASGQRTPQQNRVFHGKVSDLAKLDVPGWAEDKDALRQAERRIKRELLDEAGARLGRAFESSTELTEPEMERVLELLDDRLAKT